MMYPMMMWCDVVFLVNCLPFVGFGLLDNAVMIVAVSLHTRYALFGNYHEQ